MSMIKSWSTEDPNLPVSQVRRFSSRFWFQAETFSIAEGLSALASSAQTISRVIRRMAAAQRCTTTSMAALKSDRVKEDFIFEG